MSAVREVNPTIGRIKCPIAGDWAEVRKDKKGRFYYVGKAGMIKPNLPDGQEWFLNNAEIFDEKQKEEINANPIKFGRRFKADADFQKPAANDAKNNDDGDWLL